MPAKMRLPPQRLTLMGIQLSLLSNEKCRFANICKTSPCCIVLAPGWKLAALLNTSVGGFCVTWVCLPYLSQTLGRGAMPVNDVSLCFNHYAILRLTMRISHASVAIVVITAGVVIGTSVSDCATKCFQTAVNDNACGKWLSDPDCCKSNDFLSSIAGCISRVCSQSASEEAWTYLAEQCDKADIAIPPEYTDPVPQSSSTTSTETTTTTATSTSTITSSTASASASTTATQALPTDSPTTGTSTTGPSDTAIPGRGSIAPTVDNGSGGLSTAAKAAIAVPLTLLTLILLALFLWFRRRRRQKVTPSGIEPQDNNQTEVQEIKPLAYEISGTEISRSNDRYDCVAELEAVETSRGGGPPPPPMRNSNSAFSPQEMSSDTNLDGRVQQVGEQGAGANHGDSDYRPPNPDSSRPLETAAIPLPYSPPPTSPVSPSSPPISPIGPSSVANFSPHQMSPIKSSNNESQEAWEIQGLLSNLEAVEQRKRESASKARILEQEAAAVLAEEQALLEEIRKKTGKLPHGGASPGPGPS
ncbi:putative proline-rich antigen [Histoplasma capsulatum var. duboisii H88]|nr:putative proline-rich antigen [Histoplasma capsulatum var. duboisii H88]